MFERNVHNRIDELEKLPIWRLLVEIISLIANGIALAALHPVIVVIKNFLEWPAINDRLIALETFALFSLKRLDGYRSELNALHRPPWLRVAP